MSHRYYSPLRPLSLGTFPKPQGNEILHIENFEERQNVPEIARQAWGYIEYNPNMGVSVKESFFMDEIAVAEGSLSKKAEFLTKYCNIKQNSSIAWLEYQTVENAGVEKTLEDFRDCYAVGGIDLSQTTDLTAASVVIQKDGTLYAFTQFFMPRGRLEYLQATDGVPYDIFVKKGLITLSGENYVDYHDVYGWFNIRTGAGTNYAKTGETTGKGVFTIVEVKAGQGASAGWGRLKSGAGWISLDYATRLA